MRTGLKEIILQMSEKKVMQVFEKEISDKDVNVKGHDKDEVTVSNDFKHSKLKSEEQENKSEKVKDSAHRELFSWIMVIMIAVAVALIINCFVIINSVVPSSSMESTIMTGSRMFGFRLAYLFSEPQQGDIIIFRYPDNEKQTFVKRVIGCPGDTVEIKGGVTYVNGEVLDEPYLNETPNDDDFGPYYVPEDCYFVMGDNRNHSNDARYWKTTYVNKKQILARAVICYWPLSDFGILK